MTEKSKMLILWLVLIILTAGFSHVGFINIDITQVHAQPGEQPPREHKGPPEEAVTSCEDLNEGEVCSFYSPKGNFILGICRLTKEDIKACLPENGPPAEPSQLEKE